MSVFTCKLLPSKMSLRYTLPKKPYAANYVYGNDK